MVLLAGCGAHLGYRWDSEIAATYTTWRRWRGGIAAARRGMNLRRTPSPEQSHRPPPAICPYPPCLRPLSLLRPTAHARLLLLPSISLPFSQSLSLARCLPTGACRRHRIPAPPLTGDHAAAATQFPLPRAPWSGRERAASRGIFEQQHTGSAAPGVTWWRLEGGWGGGALGPGERGGRGPWDGDGEFQQRGGVPAAPW